jgi:hypothetical protein
MAIKHAAKAATEATTMGEKERGTLEEEQRQTQQASFGERAARPREAGDQREGGGISHEDDWGNQKAAGGKPTKDQVALDAAGGGGSPEAMATNLNSSRSNVYRTAGPGEDDSGFAINEPGVHREAAPGGGGGPQGIAIGDPGVNGNIAEDPAAAAINNSHSNIKNLREAGAGGTDPAGIAVTDEGVGPAKPHKNT